MPLVRQVLQAQEYWRLKGLSADVVILNEHPASYRDEMHEQLAGAARERAVGGRGSDRPAGVFLLRGERIGRGRARCCSSAARAVLSGERGDLASQLDRPHREPRWPAERASRRARRRAPTPRRPPSSSRPPLLFANGSAASAPTAASTSIVLDGDAETPLPWANVLANPAFGTHRHRRRARVHLGREQPREPPHPVRQRPGRRPDRRGDLPARRRARASAWGADAGRRCAATDDAAAGSCGTAPACTRFSQRERDGLATSSTVFVDADDPVKFSRADARRTAATRPRAPERLRLRRVGARTAAREASSRTSSPSSTRRRGAILARNPYNARVRRARRPSSPRAEPPLGDRRPRRVPRPQRLAAQPGRAARARALGGRFGAGLDPCAALAGRRRPRRPASSASVVFVLGQGDATARTRARSVDRYADPRRADAALRRVEAPLGRALLGAVQVRTPDDSFDVLMNRWLLYQALSCRAVGALGLLPAGRRVRLPRPAPGRHGARLRAARTSRASTCCAPRARQFVEGDVQHWWHPSRRPGHAHALLRRPAVAAVRGRALRRDAPATRASSTRSSPFLEAPPLDAGASTRPTTSRGVAPSAASLYEHCVARDRARHHRRRARPAADRQRRLERRDEPRRRRGAAARASGSAGSCTRCCAASPPLCDGARRRASAPRATAREVERLARHARARLGRRLVPARLLRRRHAARLGAERRVPDRLARPVVGRPLGARARRARRAGHATRCARTSSRRGRGLILLLTRPSTAPARIPGYIQGYPPGVRENGGQYTHAAIWAVMALARLGDGDEAVELFHMLNPINHTRDGRGRRALRRRALRPGRRRLRAPAARRARAAGPGTPARRAGCTGPGSRRSSGSRGARATFAIDPCIPAAWPGYSLTWRLGATRYEIEVENPGHRSRGVAEAWLDDRPVDPRAVPLLDDGRHHRVRAVMGEPTAPAR